VTADRGATLLKMRTPSTTTTLTDSCPPTPSWSPRNTMKRPPARWTRTTPTNCLVAEDPVEPGAQRRRTTASSAATTAIGRYGLEHGRTVGLNTRAQHHAGGEREDRDHRRDPDGLGLADAGPLGGAPGRRGGVAQAGIGPGRQGQPVAGLDLENHPVVLTRSA
jgi:hypothetical protein